MLSTLKPVTEKSLQPIAHLLRNINPNPITLLGLIFPLVFFVLVQREMYALALIVFILNTVDMLDGLVARTQNKVTAFGGFLGSTIDRVADFVVIAALGFAEGAMNGRKQILAAIGQNPILIGGKLEIAPNEWLIPVRNELLATKQQLEKARTMPHKIQKASEEAVMQMWYTREDSNL